MNKYECKLETMKHICKVRQFIIKITNALSYRAATHDNSKLREPELAIFTEFTPKLAGSTYGSDEYKAFLKDMQVALDHHYDNNQHHPEYFFRKNNSGFTGMVGLHDMTLVDIVEMLCDWKAAGDERDTHGWSMEESFEKMQEKYQIQPHPVSLTQHPQHQVPELTQSVGTFKQPPLILPSSAQETSKSSKIKYDMMCILNQVTNIS
jgi:hypothetical protein